MDVLKTRILREGRDLGRGILKVDSFVNHQVDPVLMHACGQEFALRFKDLGITRVLTAEISGIGPAIMAALALQVPVVYARKHKPVTMPEMVFLTTAPSHTKGTEVSLMVSPEYLAGGERVLIVDDFLASGATILGLIRLARAAGAQVVAVGTLIEKSFEGGRAALGEVLGPEVPIESLAIISEMSEKGIVFADESYDRQR